MQSQNLNLIISGNSITETKVIDSIGYKKMFSNFNSLQNEINTLQSQLEKIGFIEIKAQKAFKLNDSTYLSKLVLGKKYNTIYIYYNKNDISTEFLKPLAEETTNSYFKTAISNSSNILSKINFYLVKKGYPFSSIKLSDVKLN